VRAADVALEVHENGMATVTVACKKLIEEYSQKMQDLGLTVSIAPDEDYVSADWEVVSTNALLTGHKAHSSSNQYLVHVPWLSLHHSK